jgi:hypothetical protein
MNLKHTDPPYYRSQDQLKCETLILFKPLYEFVFQENSQKRTCL